MTTDTLHDYVTYSPMDPAPVADALRAYPVLQQIVAQGETVCVTDRAIRLGEFSVDFVRADGTLVVGCHRVRWSEVQRMAGLLGIKV